jgi:site-specific DNA recombinase
MRVFGNSFLVLDAVLPTAPLVTGFLHFGRVAGRCFGVVAVGYVRVSTEGQAEDGVSLDAQREKIEAWAKLHDETEVAIYEDAGISGASMDQRPGLQDALREVCRRKGVLVIYSLSRLARSTKDTLTISERIAKAGAELVSLSERIDTTTASGKLAFRMLAVLAEFERDQISERTRAAMAHLRSSQRRFSRFAPYGWDFDDDGEVLLPNLVEQRVIGRMIELRVEGLTFQAIAERLTEEVVPTKHGGRPWTAKVVWTTVRRGIPIRRVVSDNSAGA